MDLRVGSKHYVAVILQQAAGAICDGPLKANPAGLFTHRLKHAALPNHLQFIPHKLENGGLTHAPPGNVEELYNQHSFKVGTQDKCHQLSTPPSIKKRRIKVLISTLFLSYDAD